jgi:hypothetical protein
MRKTKHIKLFEDFKLYEAEGDVEETAPEEASASNEDEKEDIEIPKRSSAVVTKEFFNELEKEILYWFKHGEIGKVYELVDIEQERRGVTIWFHKIVDSATEPNKMWRVKYFEVEPAGKVDQMDRVMLAIDLYTYDKSEKLKQMEIDISVKKADEKFLMKRLKRVEKKVVRDPKNEEEREKQLDRTYIHLTDEFY